MILDEAKADSPAQPAPLIFQTKAGVKESLQIFRANTDTGIGEGNDQIVSLL
jgi:hypothetical protein